MEYKDACMYSSRRIVQSHMAFYKTHKYFDRKMAIVIVFADGALC